MYLDITDEAVVLKEPERTTDFYASYWQRLGPEQIARVLADNDAGELLEDRTHIMVPLAKLRELAAGRVDEGWDAEFDAMIDKAAQRGWVNDDRTAVRAHLERLR